MTTAQRGQGKPGATPSGSEAPLGPAPEGARREDPINPWWQRGFSIVGIVVWLTSMYLLQTRPDLSQGIVISLSLGTIALVTFAGFYSATGPEGMRTAIAATLVIFYLVLITHLIAAPGLRNALDTAAPGTVTAASQGGPAASAAPSAAPGAPASPSAAASVATIAFGREIFNGLTDFVKIVLLFYFTAVSAEKAVTTVANAAQNRSKIQAAAQTDAADLKVEAAGRELAAANAHLEAARIGSRAPTETNRPRTKSE